ncbi:hypothetical protein [Pseudofulvimonas gallinarii]
MDFDRPAFDGAGPGGAGLDRPGSDGAGNDGAGAETSGRPAVPAIDGAS